MKKKSMILILSMGEEKLDAIETPFNLALTATAIDVNVQIIFTGRSGRFLLKNTAATLFPKEGSDSLLVKLQRLKDEGVKIFVCSPVLNFYNIQKDEFISEIDGIVGAMYVVTESLDADISLSF